MTIIPFDESHVNRLAEIERACFAEPWSPQALREELDNPCACFRTAVDPESGEIAGYIGCHIVLEEGYIANVAVAPEWRRRGVGRQLVQALLAEAQANGLAFVTLEVRASNRAAQGLYHACGFVCVGRRPGFYQNPPEDAVLMTREFTRKGTRP